MVILIVDYVISECFLSLLLLLKCQFKNYTWECIANAKINKERKRNKKIKSKKEIKSKK